MTTVTRAGRRPVKREQSKTARRRALSVIEKTISAATAFTLAEVLIAIVSDLKQTFYFRDDSVSHRQERVRENKMFAFAFTLAEVLITLGIIGLIADMTIPTLQQSFQEKVLKTSFKKAYSTLSQAWRLAIVQDGPFTDIGGWWTCPDGSGDHNTTEPRTEAVKSKMNVIKSCINEEGCWAKDYELYGQVTGYTLNSNTIYSWRTADSVCWSNPWKSLDEAHIMVDTNCEKKPNQIGQDIFSFLLGVDGNIYFAIDDLNIDGAPFKKGKVCPLYDQPQTINGRNVDFHKWLVE